MNCRPDALCSRIPGKQSAAAIAPDCNLALIALNAARASAVIAAETAEVCRGNTRSDSETTPAGKPTLSGRNFGGQQCRLSLLNH